MCDEVRRHADGGDKKERKMKKMRVLKRRAGEEARQVWSARQARDEHGPYRNNSQQEPERKAEKSGQGRRDGIVESKQH